MAKYDQMLLALGGGVIDTRSQSAACSDEACVFIGIGGTGIAALKRLKRNVYQRLQPDDPSAPVPTYSHIKFIAIDSDDIDPGQGKGKLFNSEIFDIRRPDLPGVIGTEIGKQTVKNDSSMSWMDIDNIIALKSPIGTGGIRQVGRYLLISKADSLKTKIHLACTTAMQAAHTNSVTVYIFAGISGGTGSGCFIDTCYIVRQLMNENGWAASGKIMGFFFLPDVILSRREVAASPAAVRWNNCNGYAAMKELDYLMNLTQAEDHFYQNYGGFVIDTSAPPVDMCYLVSATNAEGSVLEDGFDHSINTVSDYVMSYLYDISNVPDYGMVDTSITLLEHLADINTGISVLPRTHGAKRIYNIFGTANAEIPMTQIMTYLAAGFMDRFSRMVGRETVIANFTRQKVDEWVEKLDLTADGILAKVKHGTTSFMLPEVDRGVLKSLGQMPRGKAPESWATPGNNFLNVSEGKRTVNCNGLKQGIADYSPENLPTGQTASVIRSIFDLLQNICTNPEYGPYYAAHLIHNNGYDLEAVIDGLIATYEEQKGTQELNLYGRGTGGIADEIVQASADYIKFRFFFNEGSAYSRYKKTVEDYYITTNRIKELESAISVMKIVKLQLNQLNQAYFVPMIEMLDNLKETFDENRYFLRHHEIMQASSCSWQILSLRDIQERLDETIKDLTPWSIVGDFLRVITKEYHEWINKDSDRITAFISRFMIRTFAPQMDLSLLDYLRFKYPVATTPPLLVDRIEKEIISPLFYNAGAMFWCNPYFSIDADTYQTMILSVPESEPYVFEAAEIFKKYSQWPCVVRKTALKDRISMMRLFSGIPFYAYKGVDFLKADYDIGRRSHSGAGVHLYAKTGRGNDGTGDKDWGSFLPEPVPYSVDIGMTENADEKISLYERACELGIIGMDTSGLKLWLIKVSKPIDEKSYSIDDFMTRDPQGRSVLDKLTMNSVRSRIEDRIEHGWKDENLERVIVMKNDGDLLRGEVVVSSVRLDYFLAFPVQQNIVREEVRKHDVLDDQLRQLKEIEDQYYRQYAGE